MFFKKAGSPIMLLQAFALVNAIRPEENGKDLPNNIDQYEYLARRRRPSSGSGNPSGCNFNGMKGGVYKTDGSGRTFFDLSYINVGYNHQYNINCGGLGGHNEGGGSHDKPSLGGHKPLSEGHKPFGGHKPGLGGNKPGLGGHNPSGEEVDHMGGNHQGNGGFLANRPILSMILANRPLQGLFSQSQSQTQASTQTGIFSDAISQFTMLFPSPQEFGQGLGEGISSFVQTLPQIGQSFQGLLPDFSNFNFPSFPSIPQGSQGGSPPSNPIIPTTSAPLPITTTTDPDDIIYNDDIKPVHEDHDLITDPYNNINKLPPGANKYYQQNSKNYYNQRIPYYNKFEEHYNNDIYRQREVQSRQFRNDLYRTSGRSFKFPS